MKINIKKPIKYKGDKMAIIMDGIKLRNSILTELRAHITEKGLQPKLVAILVGDDAASKIYVRNKEKYASVA